MCIIRTPVQSYVYPIFIPQEIRQEVDLSLSTVQFLSLLKLFQKKYQTNPTIQSEFPFSFNICIIALVQKRKKWTLDTITFWCVSNSYGSASHASYPGLIPNRVLRKKVTSVEAIPAVLSRALFYVLFCPGVRIRIDGSVLRNEMSDDLGTRLRALQGRLGWLTVLQIALESLSWERNRGIGFSEKDPHDASFRSVKRSEGAAFQIERSLAHVTMNWCI